MAEPGGPPMRLKEWLVAQIESGQYPGLRWESSEKKLFRIPWKHAAKQDYRQREDAALFKAWAIYKGKYHEGLDKADPSAWKTRLRCALNKSADFKEVPSRSHLDISEPYKVYEIASEPAQDADKENGKESAVLPSQPSTSVHQETIGNCKPHKTGSSSSESAQEASKDEAMAGGQGPPAPQKPAQAEHSGYHVKGVFYGWSPAQFHCHPCPSFISPRPQYHCSESINSDCWLRIRLYYCGVLVKDVTTHTAEGCRITYRPIPADNECLYGPSIMEQIQFPSLDALAGNSRVSRALGVLEQLLPHLHRGVLLWVAPEGVFMKRQCQGRVYWKGPLAPHNNQPNKLERERTYKLLDTQQFLQELRGYLTRGEPPPQYQIQLCFGEEYPAAPNQKLQKFIMAHVEPVFAQELFLHAQQLGPQSLQDSQPCSSDAPRNIVEILKQLCPP
ncbi:interferon regulatory factor 4-like [Hemicordylus capensis]|uniref:interferon regulatory factor 4-like n=1 Tax=Hemicordylus capensis TaxID=884348 RepID=UPI0023034AF6|nr:interferon regulatory factor 4-like [Hemicordylus capensis]